MHRLFLEIDVEQIDGKPRSYLPPLFTLPTVAPLAVQSLATWQRWIAPSAWDRTKSPKPSRLRYVYIECVLCIVFLVLRNYGANLYLNL